MASSKKVATKGTAKAATNAAGAKKVLVAKSGAIAKKKTPAAKKKSVAGASGPARISKAEAVLVARTPDRAPTTPRDPHEHLQRVDVRFSQVIARAGRCPLPERAKDPPNGEQSFRSLVNAIVSQQLSGKAAETIFARVEALGGGTLPGPAGVLALADEALRAAGLSGAKTRGVKDLATRVLDGSLALDALHEHTDEAVIEALVKVRGIGRWTAEMFLMFRLGRPDVLSTGDLGLRKGMMRLCGLRELPDPATMERLSAPWRPFRSVASWYLWRIAEETAAAKEGAEQSGRAKNGAANKQPAAPEKATSRAERVAAKR